ncbi:MAG: bifunctional phosphoglucose/phosphomannose isomerase [Minisyncoccia bacterium]
MEKLIYNFINQLDWDPKIYGQIQNKNFKKVIVCGMGGSHLGADILKSFNLNFEINIWSNYNLPQINKNELKDYFVVIDSYSGNTEEALSSFFAAQKLKLNIGIITSGGKLLNLAKKYQKPYVLIPNTGIQPRHALGYQILALAKILNQEKIILNIKNIKNKINIFNLEKGGKKIAKEIFNFVPIIYSSENNKSLAYNWKIKFNESSKIPAFYNVFPELNHNEMQGFDVLPQTKKLSENFYFLFLYDQNDDLKIKKRMIITANLYKKRDLKVKLINLKEKNNWLKIFNVLFLGDWISYYLAKMYNTDFEKVKMVEEFKKRL